MVTCNIPLFVNVPYFYHQMNHKDPKMLTIGTKTTNDVQTDSFLRINNRTYLLTNTKQTVALCRTVGEWGCGVCFSHPTQSPKPVNSVNKEESIVLVLSSQTIGNKRFQGGQGHWNGSENGEDPLMIGVSPQIALGVSFRGFLAVIAQP